MQEAYMKGIWEACKIFSYLLWYMPTQKKKKKAARGEGEAVNLCCKSYSVVPALCPLTGIECGGTLLLPPMAGPSFQRVLHLMLGQLLAGVCRITNDSDRH